MKVTSIDLDRLIFAIAPFDTLEVRARFAEAAASGKLRYVDLDARYRWYIFNRAWDAGFRFPEGSDYKTAHIDTALRKAIPPLSEAVDPATVIPDANSRAVTSPSW
jgi:hypothetical protein